MAVIGKRVTVGTSATKLNTSTPTANDPTIGSSLLVRAGSVSLFLGGPDVTSASGFELLAGFEVPIDLGNGEDIYGAVASGSVICHVLEVGV